VLEEGLFQEAPSSTYDTGSPHRDLTNFHEILTIALGEESKVMRHSKMLRSARLCEEQKVPNPSGDRLPLYLKFFCKTMLPHQGGQ
jgi:hypothetical protein